MVWCLWVSYLPCVDGLFSVLRILSLTVSLSLCLLWDCVGLRKRKVLLLNEEDSSF